MQVHLFNVQDKIFTCVGFLVYLKPQCAGSFSPGLQPIGGRPTGHSHVMIDQSLTTCFVSPDKYICVTFIEIIHYT